MTYPKDLRKQAKAKKMGLITISFTRSTGETITLQGVADEEELSIVDKAYRDCAAYCRARSQ